MLEYTFRGRRVINPKQRSKLRSMAHKLRPIVIIGKSGITDGVIHSINTALESHELIKVKFSENKTLKDKFIDVVEKKLSGFVVGRIGHTLIIFRPQDDENKRKINI